MKMVVVAECGLRVGTVVALVLAACLVGLDSQTKYILFLDKTVTYKNLNSLIALVYVDIAAAAYNLTRLVLTLLMGGYRRSRSPSSETSLNAPIVSWGCYFLDQMGVYVTFVATLAALQQCSLVMTGQKELQWLKWCNKFTRFCLQIGGGLFCSFIACILMALISFISGFHLFRLYSPTRFLRLKEITTPPPATATVKTLFN
ncbi:unnamed protein product [Linum trigynum]|uniref:CASP-like protein n=1 Tax=Linum trigynum TaxID=586398 RepID=A0AAV2GXH8_9ROSI